MARDLKADLELCNGATKGPWCQDLHNRVYINTGEKDEDYICVFAAEEECGDYYFFPNREHNREFIAQAREGWPYAIEQAIAEKERADKTHQIAMSLIQQLGGVLELVKDGVFVEQFDVDGPALCIPLILMVAFQELRRAREALGDE